MRARVCRCRYFVIDDKRSVRFVKLKVPPGFSVRDPVNRRKGNPVKCETLQVSVVPGTRNNGIAVARQTLLRLNINNAIVGSALNRPIISSLCILSQEIDVSPIVIVDPLERPFLIGIVRWGVC